MAQKQMKTGKWLTKNRGEMIACPHQPGQLMISKTSCSKRYQMSRRENLKDLMKGDFFHYTYLKGLTVCRECPIGKKLSVVRPTSRLKSAANP